MSKVSRADHAETVPWTGISGKPAVFPSTLGVTDIGQLTGNGYSTGQYPRYSPATGRFVPATLTPDPSPTTGYTEQIVYWDAPSLHAMQSAWEDFTFTGAAVGDVVTLGSPFTDEFVIAVASVPAADTVRITVTNLGFADVDLANGVWKLRI